MSSIITVSEAKEYLGITDATYDDVLDALCEGYSDLVRSLCGREFDYDTYSEKIDIYDEQTDTVVVRETPLHSVVALTDNGNAVSTDEYLVNETEGSIKLKSGVFTYGYGKVEVTYVAGYTPSYPDGLKLLVKILVAEDFNMRSHHGMSSEKIGDYSLTLRVRRKGEYLPPQAQILIEQYKRMIL